MKYYQPFLLNTIYHVFSRAVGNEKLFLTDENYRFFLSRYEKYIDPAAETIAYNLLPNHFHLIVHVRSEPELLALHQSIKPHRALSDGWEHDIVMQQFSNLLNSYSKSFNKTFRRTALLFINSIKRISIEGDTQLSSTIFYVHKNAVHHGYCKSISDWKWSSLSSFLSASITKIKKDWILNFYGDQMAFMKFHSQPIYLKHAVVIE